MALLVTVIELGGLYIGALTVVRLLDPDARFPWSPYVSGIVVIAIVSIPWVLMRRVESLRRQRERRPSA